jgi:hypothetical protein
MRGEVGDRLKVGCADIGEQQRPIQVYKVLIGWQVSEPGHAPQTPHTRFRLVKEREPGSTRPMERPLWPRGPDRPQRNRSDRSRV